MKNILVPTDFSPCSTVAHSYAAMLAEKTGAVINLITVLEIGQSTPATTGMVNVETTGDYQYMMSLMKLTQARMKNVHNSKVFKNVEVNDHIIIGGASEKIVEASKKLKADMIVMGTHGMSGVSEKFIGSNAERVVRNAGVPVLSVKNDIKNPKIDKILFATDFSKEAESVLPEINKMADLMKAKLVLSKIITPGDYQSTSESEKEIEEFREKTGIYNYIAQIHYAYSREEGIRTAAEAVGANMIAMGTHGRHGLAQLFKGSIAESVVNRAPIPVLTINFTKKSSNGQAHLKKK